MTKPIILSLALGIATVGSAQASPIDPTKSSIDHVLVGTSSGADIGNGFRVVTRDVGNIAVAGVSVAIRFLTSGARSDAQQEAGSTASCPNETITRVTGFDGETIFHVAAGGYDNGQIVEVRGNGFLIGHVQVRSTDINADGVTDLRDLNAFRERFVSDRSAPETDFNLDGVTNGYDFALLRAEFVRGVRNTVCP